MQKTEKFFYKQFLIEEISFLLFSRSSLILYEIMLDPVSMCKNLHI
jgi:hypothetical protein